jgi:hypothetical protein
MTDREEIRAEVARGFEAVAKIADDLALLDLVRSPSCSSRW